MHNVNIMFDKILIVFFRFDVCFFERRGTSERRRSGEVSKYFREPGMREGFFFLGILFERVKSGFSSLGSDWSQM